MQEKQKIQVQGSNHSKIFSEGTLVVIPDDVLQVKNQLELRSGSRLILSRPSPLEISLTCHNLDKYLCGFKYLFRKSNEDPEKAEYLLHTEFESHHLQCLTQNFGEPKRKSDIISSPSFKRYKPEVEHSPESFSPKLFSLSSKYDQGQKMETLERSLMEESLMLRTKHSTKFYTEDEVSALKKQLQFQSKGLISKSTEFHTQLGYITKIAFRCKYENNNCPYLATLTYTHDRNSKSQKLYRLDKVHNSHANSCLLDSQEVHYNFVTRKIDENFGVLTRLIRQNSLDMKPKRVLEVFAQQIGEEPDFIYMGIESKGNRRAAKKYFDNSVAKARNTLKQDKH